METAATNVAETVVQSKPRKENEKKKILSRDFRLKEQAFADRSIVLPEGHTIKDALLPEYWVNVAHLLASPPMTREPDQRWSIIEVRTSDGMEFARLYIIAVQEKGLIVEVMKPDQDGICRFGPKEIPSKKFRWRWNVGARGYDIIRNSDNQIVGQAKDFQDKDKALAWIKEMEAS